MKKDSLFSMALTFTAVMAFVAVFLAVVTPKSEKNVGETAASRQIKKADAAIQASPGDTSKDRDADPVNKAGRYENTDAVVEDGILHHPDPAERILEIRRLRGLVSLEAVEQLSRFLQDADPSVLEAALDSLAFIALHSDLEGVVFDILKDKAADTEFSLRGYALVSAALLKKPRELLDLVSAYAASDKEEDWPFAVRAMALAPLSQHVDIIGGMLSRLEDRETVNTACSILAKMDSPAALDLLAKNILASNGTLQKGSIWALSRYNFPDQNRLLAQAVTNMQLSDDSVGIIATSPAAPYILAPVLLNDQVGVSSKIEILDTIAENAINATGKTRSDIGTMLEEIIYSGEPELELEAIRALAKIGDSTDRSYLLLPRFESDNPDIREAALLSFAQYCTPRTYKNILNLYWDDDPIIRRTAFNMTARFLDSSDQAIIEAAASHQDEFISSQIQQIKKQIL